MSKRIIINNNTELTDSQVMNYVLKVIDSGKLSKSRFGYQYTFLTTFWGIDAMIYCQKNAPSKKYEESYTFWINNA